jgi:hypothetical protein
MLHGDVFIGFIENFNFGLFIFSGVDIISTKDINDYEAHSLYIVMGERRETLAVHAAGVFLRTEERRRGAARQ